MNPLTDTLTHPGMPEDGAKGHVWEKDEKGEIEYIEPYNEDDSGHAGPLCERCGYWYCIHCHDEPQEECDPE